MASDAVAGDHFGEGVALLGDTIVVGAFTKNSNTGSAYLFYRSGTVWTQQQILSASNGATGDFFGVKVGLSATTAIVGAQGHSSSTGAAYLYPINPSAPTNSAHQRAHSAGPVSPSRMRALACARARKSWQSATSTSARRVPRWSLPAPIARTSAQPSSSWA